MTSRVSKSAVAGREILHLHDDESGASASILPSYGFNLFDLVLPLRGVPTPVVVTEPNWAENPSRPARHGFPILFPFPGRIRGAAYSFQGKSYELIPNKAPHAIHGFALEAPWDVVEHGVGPQGATALGRFQISRNAAAASERWPADAILEVRYTLRGSKLSLEARVTNPDTRPLPWGFGLHSYFRLPLQARSDLSDAKLIVPCEKYWVLEQGLPTGETRDVEGTRFDYRTGRPISELEADDALTQLGYAGATACRLVDDHLGCELVLEYGEDIREIVVFTPQGSRGVVAVEPYTQMADAFALEALGRNSGLRVLLPSESSSFYIQVESRSL